MRTGELVNKLIGAGMMLGSMVTFASPFMPDIAGLVLLVGGIALVARREPADTADPRLLRKIEQLTQQVAALQDELGTAQRQLGELRDQRDFMQQLQSPPPPPPSREP